MGCASDSEVIVISPVASHPEPSPASEEEPAAEVEQEEDVQVAEEVQTEPNAKGKIVENTEIFVGDDFNLVGEKPEDMQAYYEA